MADVRIYNTPKTGELVGVTTATQLPDIPCQMVMFVATNSNPSDVYLGISGVTVAAGTTTTTAGYELRPGATTGWIPVSNLNLFYRKCDAATDDLTYLALE